CHVSASFARAELMDFVGLLLKDKRIAASLAAELGLEAEEIALLLGSTPSTKKVQSIFEEAMRIRSAEEIEEIELAWGATARTSASPMVEMLQTAEPAAKPAPASPVKKEGRRRGRPQKNKTRDEEAGGPKASAAASEEKRQKSLFDF
ncbi:MAG: replication factor C large subunit, partial [Methanothrix sp.]|nr:replication factor C large subunit [Methanothrix sp.]